MSELQGLQLHFPEFAARDCTIVAVAVDSQQDNAGVVANLDLRYRVLSDPHLEAIDRYDLRHVDGGIGHDMARPASFLIDRTGVIRWRDLTENYRIRPRPEAILAELDRLQG